MSKKTPPKLLPALTLEEVLATAKTDIDRRVKEYLFENLPKVTYQSWFHNTGFVAREDGKFYVNGIYARDYINVHFSDHLDKAYNIIKRENKGIYQEQGF